MNGKTKVILKNQKITFMSVKQDVNTIEMIGIKNFYDTVTLGSL